MPKVCQDEDAKHHDQERHLSNHDASRCPKNSECHLGKMPGFVHRMTKGWPAQIGPNFFLKVPLHFSNLEIDRSCSLGGCWRTLREWKYENGLPHREGAKLAALVKPFVAGRLQGFFNRDGKGEIPTLSTTEAPVQPTVVHVLPIKLFRLTGLHKKCCKKKLF